MDPKLTLAVVLDRCDIHPSGGAAKPLFQPKEDSRLNAAILLTLMDLDTIARIVGGDRVHTAGLGAEITPAVIDRAASRAIDRTFMPESLQADYQYTRHLHSGPSYFAAVVAAVTSLLKQYEWGANPAAWAVCDVAKAVSPAAHESGDETHTL